MIFPYRCSTCRTRFLRYHKDQLRDPMRVFRNPSPAVRSAFWFTIAIVVAIAVSFLIALFGRK